MPIPTSLPKSDPGTSRPPSTVQCRFQIMGYDREASGYSNVQDFVQAMQQSEGKQIDAFANSLQ